MKKHERKRYLLFSSQHPESIKQEMQEEEKEDLIKRVKAIMKKNMMIIEETKKLNQLLNKIFGEDSEKK